MADGDKGWKKTLTTLSRPFKAAWAVFKSYYVIGLFGLVFILLAEKLPHAYYADHIARDLGISFWVACIVIITIEHKQRQELNRTINGFIENTNAHVFQTLFGTEFQEDKWKFIRESIMKQQFYRINTNIIYTIRHVEPAKRRYGLPTVLLESDLTQVVKNITGKRVIYPVKSIVERDTSVNGMADPAESPSVRMFVDDIELNEQQMTAADTKWKDTIIFSRHEHPLEIDPGKEKKIRIISTISTKLVADTEVWRSIYSCDGLRFIINYPKDLRVFAEKIHSTDAVFMHQSETMIMGEIKDPLLPYNGFMFWWFPCEAPPCEQIPSNTLVADLRSPDSSG